MSSARPAKPAIRDGGLLGRTVVAVVLGAVRALPPRVRNAVALQVAALAWHLRIRRAVALDNLAHAFPEKTEAERRGIARGTYDNLALAALESVTSDLLPDSALDEAVRVADWKGLDAILHARQPALVVSAHFGSWELFAEVMARRDYAMSAVVRPLTGAFNAWVVRNRKLAGMELILQRGALGEMLKALKRGRAVVQLIDQVLPAKDGVFVPFFGRLASTTPAVSMAALRSKAPVYVVLAARDGAQLRMFVEGPFPLEPLEDRRAALTAHTAALTACIERYVRQYPSQWLWLHRRWKVQPPATAS
ncbi:MAG: lipid A biosynthesis acyltransferase [Archangium sp.]|nr:lipid A biosynthesis acyltransferase [Archangium sp.]